MVIHVSPCRGCSCFLSAFHLASFPRLVYVISLVHCICISDTLYHIHCSNSDHHRDASQSQACMNDTIGRLRLLSRHTCMTESHPARVLSLRTTERSRGIWFVEERVVILGIRKSLKSYRGLAPTRTEQKMLPDASLLLTITDPPRAGWVCEGRTCPYCHFS